MTIHDGWYITEAILTKFPGLVTHSSSSSNRKTNIKQTFLRFTIKSGFS